MSTSQHESDLREENRELRQRLQGALADLADAQAKALAAQEARVQLEDVLMHAQQRVRQLEAEKALMWDKINN